MPTDTERLDWLIAHRAGWCPIGFWESWDKYQGTIPATPRDTDPRKCIDLAIFKEDMNALKI